MKNIIILLSAFLMLSSVAFSEIKATIDPLDIGVGTRALGMGKAFIAVADDANSVFFNPAGLGTVQGWGITSMYTSLLSEITFQTISMYHSSSMEAIGFGYAGANLSGNIYTSYRDPITNRIVPLDVVAAGYTSNVMIFSYGLTLGKYFDFPHSDRISFGISIKEFYQSLKATSDEATASGYNLDAGLIYRVNSWLKTAIYGQNIMPASSGGTLKWSEGEEESIPSSYKLGMSLKILGSDALRDYPQDLYYNLDLQGSAQGSRPTIYHTGLEWWLYDFLALRMGIDQDVYSKGEGNGVDNNITFGLGLWRGDFGFDYAYHQYGHLSENTTHYFSLSYGFPGIYIKPATVEVIGKGEEVKVTAIDCLKIIGPLNKSLTDKAFIDLTGRVLRGDVATVEVNGTAAEISGEPIKAFAAKVQAPKPGKYLIRIRCLNDKGDVLQEYSLKVIRLMSFIDVPDNYWAKDKIDLLASLDLFGGYPDGTFRPDRVINRAELTALLIRAKGITATERTDTMFKDVSKAHWASGFIRSGVNLGFVTGYPDKTFKPAKSLSRAEGVTILSRFAGLEGPEVIAEGPFADVPGRHWAAKSILAAKTAGMLTYLYEKPFEPKKEMTRAEAAEILSQTQLAKDKSKELLNWDIGF